VLPKPLKPQYIAAIIHADALFINSFSLRITVAFQRFHTAASKDANNYYFKQRLTSFFLTFRRSGNYLPAILIPSSVLGAHKLSPGVREIAYVCKQRLFIPSSLLIDLSLTFGVTDAYWCVNKKLSYRRGTAPCAMSVEILLTAAQLYERSHLKRFAVGE